MLYDFHQLLMHYHHDYRAVEQLMTAALSHREKWIRLTLTQELPILSHSLLTCCVNDYNTFVGCLYRGSNLPC